MNRRERKKYLCKLIEELNEEQLTRIISLIRGMMGKQEEPHEKNIPVRVRKPGKYHFTQQDKEYIQSFAVNGEVPFDAYISAVNKILNGLAPHQVK